MGNKKVSIVVATYNQEKYIRKTLESIVSQKADFEFEAIVGDDCSTDGNAEIIREFAEKYPDIIVPVFREKNLGMTGNTLDIMMRAQGEYIAFIEGDDYWLDEKKLQKQVDFLDSHPDYVACFGLCHIVDAEGNRQEKLEQWSGFMKEGGEYTLKMFQDYLLPGQTATSMYRRVAYGALQQKLMAANIDISQMIDRSQVLCMLAVGKMYNLGEYLAAYRYVLTEGSGSWSSQNDFYSKDNVLKYMAGMKDMEKTAKVLGLDLNFDDRRKYELYKLEACADKFSKEDYKVILNQLIEDSYDKKGLKRIHSTRHLRGLILKLKGRI
ncbi:Glycosyl transferase family 2 [Pseudobutyrivibrio sp. UC1225]|uniref:glycosyltransferase family 2 protein n=1 Tax=Pseudobutyrivibrio sp. UC1225 TaxID=1798185 RepID=UPI0008E145A4|nr:glycosyltransferase [Pseudobutyrivibrio sp. UC1225]SFO24842.1 Glycosyl transferase family 2 [Pseudobutyrivibrio sp. UC1225]